MTRSFLLFATLFSLPLLASAQDTRTVTEPVYPHSCTVLQAHLQAPLGVLSAANEHRTDTARIQSAIDQCPAGNAVELKAAGSDNIFLMAPIRLKAGVTLRVDQGVAVFASRDPRDYDSAPGSCGILTEHGHGCKALITALDAPGSGIMGEGAIDGRGGETLLGQNETWWDLAHRAKVQDKLQNCFRLIRVDHSDNFTLYKITLRNSPNSHVDVFRTNGFTAWGIQILTPKTARNTDGIDPQAGTTNVTVAYSVIHTGDDNMAIKSDPRGAASHMSILHNHFYTGHGMSIGSQTAGGVENIAVTDLSIDGADNGLRIESDRSRGGLVQSVSFTNVCIRDVRNPLVFSPIYTTFNGSRLPIFRDIALHNVHVVTPGAYTFYGLDAEHKLGITLDNVTADGLDHSEVLARNAEITLHGAAGNLHPTGEGVSVAEGSASNASAIDCTNAFATLPEDRKNPVSAEKILPEDKTFYVAADGTGDYYSIQRAIDVAPAGAVILVAPGSYREVLTIDKPNMQLRSANPDASKTIIVNDRSASSTGTTSRSATVNVHGDGFIAENITFQNDFNATHPQQKEGSQAVALMITADRAILHNVRLLGNQDTLYARSHGCTGDGAERRCTAARQYFSDCYIEGNIDFIFGDGKTVFDHCEIHSNPWSGGFVTAQSKLYPEQDSGYLIYKSRLTAEAGTSNVYLGRPWRPYSTVTYIDTEMGAHIEAAGWHEWNPGQTTSLNTASYSEFGSTGPGAKLNERDAHGKLLSAGDAAHFTPAEFLRGTDHWNPTAVKIPALQ